jgi:hypothetical protein
MFIASYKLAIFHSYAMETAKMSYY